MLQLPAKLLSQSVRVPRQTNVTFVDLAMMIAKRVAKALRESATICQSHSGPREVALIAIKLNQKHPQSIQKYGFTLPCVMRKGY